MTTNNLIKIGKIFLKPFPLGFRFFLIKTINVIRLKRNQRLKTPTSVVFFITSKCNLRCDHCFYWRELNKKQDELTLEQIKKIVNSFKDSNGIVLTGGEPFLRGDLFDVCKILDKKFRKLIIATNGYFPAKVYNVTSNILNECNFSAVTIQISIDGLKRIHNMVRGADNSFGNAIRTLRILKKLEKKFNNLDVEVITTISNKNYSNIEKLVKYLLQFKVPHKFVLTRGYDYGVYNLNKTISSEINPKKDVFVSIDKLKGLYGKLEDINNNSTFKFWTRYQQLFFEYSIKIIKKKKKILKCHAGTVDGVIYENGDVSLCEFTKPIGNLKETNYNFHKLWTSRKANLIREKVKNCFCIQGCNLSTSISFDDKSIFELTK